MRRGLRLPVSTAPILTGMAGTIAAGPGRAGTLKAAGFGPATTWIQDPPPIRVDITGQFWGH
ncbi:MAG: hypothetical protein WB382_21615 [Pseudolabrys sp.]